MIASRIRSVVFLSFNASEHCCAVGYAATEFTVAHSHLFLDVFSAVLLAALIIMFMLKLWDHAQKLKASSYAANELAL